MTREIFEIVLKLSKRQPWIDEKLETISNLLFNDHTSPEQRELLIDLISRIEHVDNDKYRKGIIALAEEIVSDPNLSDDSTLVVAMAADSSPDSSQKVLYDLKPVFEQYDWRNHKKVNVFGRALRAYKATKKHKNIVLVDEFIGSGSTALGRVQELSRVFKGAGVDGFSVRIRVLVSTNQGLELLRSHGLDVDAVIVINRGITDNFPPEVAPSKIVQMVELESNLQKVFNDIEMPSLGYGKTESLYCRDGGNTPNNVFPIFWWPKRKNSTDRKRLMIRAMS